MTSDSTALRTTELLNFMHKAISHGLIETGPCTYISEAFMIPKSDPSKPYRVRKRIYLKKKFLYKKILFISCFQCLLDYRRRKQDTESFDSTLPRVDQLKIFAGNSHVYSEFDLSQGMKIYIFSPNSCKYQTIIPSDHSTSLRIPSSISTRRQKPFLGFITPLEFTDGAKQPESHHKLKNVFQKTNFLFFTNLTISLLIPTL